MDDSDSDYFFTMLNIYNTYCNKKEKNTNTMFDGIDPADKSAINTRLIDLMDEIKLFNVLSDEDTTIYTNSPTDNIDAYKHLKIREKDYYCKSLIPLIKHLVDEDWINAVWTIE